MNLYTFVGTEGAAKSPKKLCLASSARDNDEQERDDSLLDDTVQEELGRHKSRRHDDTRTESGPHAHEAILFREDNHFSNGRSFTSFSLVDLTVLLELEGVVGRMEGTNVRGRVE